jgi:hypothetical protein
MLIDEALGHKREQLLLQHLALVKVQADHVLQQQAATHYLHTRAPVA